MSGDCNQQVLVELVSRYVDDNLDLAGFARLENLLRADKRARRFYLNFAELHAELAWSVGGLSPATTLGDPGFLSDSRQAIEREYVSGKLTPMADSADALAGSPDSEALPPWVAGTKSQAASKASTARRRVAGFRATLLKVARRPARFAAMVAVAVVGIVAIAVSLRPSPAPEAVARITQMLDCRWVASTSAEGAESVPCEGDDLPVGQVLELKSGDCSLQFTGGATAVVRGPVNLQLVSPTNVQLDQGVLLAKVPPRAVGFTVITPFARIVDLGTQFVVAVDRHQGTAVQVVQGRVDMARRTGDGTFSAWQVLAAGQARQVFPGGMAEVIAFNPAAHEQFQKPRGDGSASALVFSEESSGEARRGNVAAHADQPPANAGRLASIEMRKKIEAYRHRREELLKDPALAAYWTFDGNTRESVSDDVFDVQGTERYTTGAVGQAFDFDGGTKVYQAGMTLRDLVTTGYTVMAWVKFGPGSEGRLNTIVAQTDMPPGIGAGLWFSARDDKGGLGHDHDFEVAMHTAHENLNAPKRVRDDDGPDRFHSMYKTSSWQTPKSAASAWASSDEWVHLAAVYSPGHPDGPGHIAYFVNGNRFSREAVPGIFVQATKTTLGIGGHWDRNWPMSADWISGPGWYGDPDRSISDPFFGLIDELAIFARQMSAQEILRCLHDSTFSKG